MAIVHIFAAPMPAWGHITSIIVFAARLVQADPNIRITVATAGSYHERSAVALLRHFDEGNLSLLNNIRFVSLAGKGVTFFELVGPWMQSLPAFYQSLYDGKEVRCNASGNIYSALPKPAYALVDSFGLDITRIVRGISKKEVPIYVWQSAGGTAILRYSGPEEYGGVGDVAAKSQELSKTTGKTPREIEYEIWHPTAGNVVTLPGIGKIYDYECSLQLGAGDINASAPMDGFHTQLYTTMKECDGLILNNNPALEPEVTEAYREWFTKTNRPLYAIGPLVSSDPNPQYSRDREIESLPDGQKVAQFLERMRERHGPNSVVYIAFGTFWWPPSEAIFALIEEALERNIPMIIVYDDSRGKIPEKLRERLNSNDDVFMTEWAPQRYLLSHNTVGWFVSHCGNNSSMEATLVGKPMIACPIDGDQHTNAIYIDSILHIGFELIEVREWIGERPFYRGLQRVGTEQGARDEARKILTQAFGLEGEERRKNALAFSEKVQALWKEDGASRREFNHLVEALTK